LAKSLTSSGFSRHVAAVTLADAAYAPAVWALATSLEPVAPLKVFYTGLPTDAQVQALRTHPNIKGVAVIRPPDCSRNQAVVTKQQLWETLRVGGHRHVMFFDSDSFVTPRGAAEVCGLSHKKAVITIDETVKEISTSFIRLDLTKIATRVLFLRALLTTYAWPSRSKQLGLLRARDDQQEFHEICGESFSDAYLAPPARFMNRWGCTPDTRAEYSEDAGEIMVRSGGKKTVLAVMHWPWRRKPWLVPMESPDEKRAAALYREQFLRRRPPALFSSSFG
jgi:hypothetical protein